MFMSAKTLAAFAIMAAVLAPAFANVETDMAANTLAEANTVESLQEAILRETSSMETAVSSNRKLMGGITFYCCCVNCLGGATIYPWQTCAPGVPKVIGTCNPQVCAFHRICL